MLNRQHLHHHPFLMYLGVTLSCKEHLTKTARKLESRNNLLAKLAGITWEWMQIHCTSLLLCSRVLCSSVGSVHLYAFGRCPAEQQHAAGTLWLTPLLPVLSHTELPALRHKAAVDKLVDTAKVHHARPLNNDLLLLLVRVLFTIIGQPRNSVLIRRV